MLLDAHSGGRGGGGGGGGGGGVGGAHKESQIAARPHVKVWT